MVTEDPQVPPATLVGLRPRPRWPLYLAAIGLVCTLVPFHCSAHVGALDGEWERGGPLFGGVVALLFAGYALVRGARRGPLGRRGRVAIAMAALGAAAAAYGYLTIQRVGPPVALGAAATDFADRAFRDGRIDDVIAAADPQLQADAPKLRRMVAVLRRRFGTFAHEVDSSFDLFAGTDGIAGATGTLSLPHGKVAVRLTYRVAGDQVRLLGVHFDIPAEERPTDPGEALAAARALAGDLAAGALDRVRDDSDPLLELTPAFEDALRQLHARAGDAPAITTLDQRACGDGDQCLELRITGPSIDQKVKITEGSTYGLWLATAIDFTD